MARTTTWPLSTFKPFLTICPTVGSAFGRSASSPSCWPKFPSSLTRTPPPSPKSSPGLAPPHFCLFPSGTLEKQGHRQVYRATCEGHRTLFLHRSLIMKSEQTRMESVTRPCFHQRWLRPLRGPDRRSNPFLTTCTTQGSAFCTSTSSPSCWPKFPSFLTRTPPPSLKSSPGLAPTSFLSVSFWNSRETRTPSGVPCYV